MVHAQDGDVYEVRLTDGHKQPELLNAGQVAGQRCAICDREFGPRANPETYGTVRVSGRKQWLRSCQIHTRAQRLF
jgi:hypothetical protein